MSFFGPAAWGVRLATRALSPEGVLSLAGCTMACASGSFALYMALHAPSSGPHASSYFTVFAQLQAQTRAPGAIASAKVAAVPAEVDPIVTGSIPSRAAKPVVADAAPDGRPIIRSMLLQQVDGDNALIEINQNLVAYRVGDLVPGAGRLLAVVLQDGRPALEMSKGLIVSPP